MRRITLCFLGAAYLWGIAACSSAPVVQENLTEPPHLEQRGEATQLIVHGKPFLALSGELAGSSATSALYMEQFWPEFRKAGLNTLLATVYWEQLEPEEGKFDFTRVDDLIDEISEHSSRCGSLPGRTA